MDTLTTKTLATRRGFIYTYLLLPAQPGKRTLLLQHGFPDSATLWRDLIDTHLRPAGYGAIAVDQLGYGGTSKPTNPAAYNLSAITDDLVDILNAEGLVSVVSVGHDWGAGSAQLLYNLHPERVAALVLVNVGYHWIPTPFDLDAIIATQTNSGGNVPWCWKFYTAADGARLLEENLELWFAFLHSPEAWPNVLNVKDGLRKFIESKGKGYPLSRRTSRRYASRKMRRGFVTRLRRGGLEAPLCWYRSMVFGHQDGVGNPANNVANVPVLFIAYKEAIDNAEELMQPAVQAGFLPRLTVVTLDGH